MVALMPTENLTSDADTLGRRIRTARSRAGLYQRELAEALGISVHHLCRVERDHVKPSTVLVGKIARRVDVSVDELLGSAA